MDSFLSNIFPWMGHQQKLARAAEQAALASTLKVETQPTSAVIPQSMTVDTSVEMDVSECIVDEILSSPEMTSTSRKRNRRLSTPTLICITGNTAQSTPSAVVTPCHSDIEDDSSLFRPKKIFRGTKHLKLRADASSEAASVPDIVCEPTHEGPKRSACPFTTAELKEDAKRTKILTETPLDLLPEDIMAHTLSFVSDVSNRFALQCASKQFHRISSTPSMMHKINVGGDPDTGVNGIILETDTKETATARLSPFVSSGNLEAIYMLGIIKSYCDCDVENGIALLKMASSQGFVRASYALGLVLRDTSPDDAYYYMSHAANQKYLPALQELLPANEMKEKYGEPSADVLRSYLDHLCLNRLLSRSYISSSSLRSVNTSHCWNHLCGRWAYKANNSSPNNFVHERVRSPPSSTSHHRRSASNTTSGSTSSSSLSTDTQSHKNRVSRMKMCSRCCRAKYCSKLCQVYDWRSGRHKMECHFL